MHIMTGIFAIADIRQFSMQEDGTLCENACLLLKYIIHTARGVRLIFHNHTSYRVVQNNI
jgi:hypothetical protein